MNANDFPKHPGCGRAGWDDAPLPHSVAIVAMGASSSDYVNRCAQHGERFAVADETWAVNAMGGVIEHDRVFACDDISELIRDSRGHGKKVASGMLDWLPTHTKPVYTIRRYAQIPHAIEYPTEEVLNRIGFPYLNNTVAYAVAYAMYIGVKGIKLFGADFSYPNAPNHQGEAGRACVEWLLGMAGAEQIHIELSETTTLMDAYLPQDGRLYGYDEPVVPEQYCTKCGNAMNGCPHGGRFPVRWRLRYPKREEAAQHKPPTVTDGPIPQHKLRVFGEAPAA